jgi:HEAT repeat protein/beta-lactamase regulating signal transducer with metallopeptidase domain
MLTGLVPLVERLADVSLRSTLVLIVAAAMALALRRASAATRHLVWSSALAGVLLLPFAASQLPAIALPILAPAIEAGHPGDGAAARVAQDATTPPDPATRIDARPPAPRESERVPTSDRDADAGPTGARPPLAAIDGESLGLVGAILWVANNLALLPALVVVLWLAGAVVLVARLAVGVARISWITRLAVRPAESHVQQLAEELGHAVGLRRAAAVLTSDRIHVPMTWGWIRPAVLIPIDAAEWTSERLRVVLLHELAHVKRGDWATQVVAQIACAAYWFNPFVWIAARCQRIERERACDATVLAAGTCASSYANHLLEIARSRMEPAWSSLPAVAMARRSQLEGRLVAILDPRTRRAATRAGRSLAVVATIAAVLLLAALEPSARAQPRTAAATVQQAADGQRVASATQAAAATQIDPAPPATTPKPIAPGGSSQPAQSAARPVVPQSVDEILKLVEEATRRALAQLPDSDGLSTLVGEALGSIDSAQIDQAVDEAVAKSERALHDTRAVEKALSQLGRLTFDFGAAGQSGDAADERLVDVFIAALKDSDAEVRERAAWALGKERAARSADALIGALKDAEPDVREQAAWALGQIRAAQAIEALAGALKDGSPDVAERAAWALGQIRNPSSVAGLIAGVGHAEPDVREQIAWALGQIGERQAVQALVRLLDDAEPDVREQAAWALGQIRDPAAVDGLVAALDDQDADVREQIVWALGQISDARAVPGLIGALNDSEPDVVENAVWALGRLRDERSRDALIGALQKGSPEVRRRVIEALTGGISDPKPEPQPRPDPRPGATRFDWIDVGPNSKSGV